MDLLDIRHCIGLSLDYKSILSSRQVCKEWSQFYGDENYWLDKCCHDFDISPARYQDIKVDLKIDQEVYVYLCGKYEYPVYGAEKYGKIYNLAKKAILQDNPDLPLAEHLAKLCLDPKILSIVSRINHHQLIDELSLIYSDPYKQIALGACRSGNMELLSTIPANYAISMWKENGLSLIHKTIKSGNLSMVKIYIPGIEDKYWLYSACKTEKLEIVDEMLKLDGDDYYDGFCEACKRGSEEIVDRLLPYCNIIPPLAAEFAAQNGHFKIMEKLLEKDKATISGAFLGVAFGGYLSQVEELYRRYPDISQKIINQALDYAAMGGNLQVIKLLISYGANSYDTALLHAAEDGNLEVLKYLRPYIGEMSDPDFADHLHRVRRDYYYCGYDIDGELNISKYHDIKEILKYVPERKYENLLKDVAYNGNLDIARELMKLIKPSPELLDEIMHRSLEEKNFHVVLYLVSQGIIIPGNNITNELDAYKIAYLKKLSKL